MDDERIMLVTDTLASSWLDIQCRMIPNVISGMAAFSIADDRSIGRAPCWPTESPADAELASAIDLAIIRRASVISSQDATDPQADSPSLIIAYPLLNQKKLMGVVAVKLKAKQEQQAAVIQLLQWGAAWLEMLLAQQEQSSVVDSSALFACLSSTLQAPDTDSALKSSATVLAQKLACERVTIGLIEGTSVKLVALSNSAHFQPQSTLVRCIEASMQEAIIAGETLIYPSRSAISNNENNLEAHQQLSTNENGECICTLVLTKGLQAIGAICLERNADSPFDSNSVTQCEQTVHLLGPVIGMRQRENRSPMSQLIEDSVIARFRSLFGPNNLGKRITAASALMLILLASFGSGDYRITAPAGIEGAVQRVIVAPFDGYIAQTHIRAGETVKSGQVMAELDDRKLNLEYQKWRGKRDEYAKHYRKALAGLDHSEARIVQAQLAQADAQLASLEEQLERTSLVAPFDGLIISGNLDQSLGTPVERGQILFEVAPLDNYRIALQVDGRDMPDIRVGQAGTLVLAAMPGQGIEFSVEKIASITQSKEGAPAFRVEGVISGHEDIHALRPGMQGIGKVTIGSRNYLWVWTRTMIGWLQLRLWSWLP